MTIAERLEELRAELRAERISYGELHELQSLAEHIDPGDVELREAAGVPEFPQEEEPERCARWISGRQCHHFTSGGSRYCAMHKGPEPAREEA